MIRRLGQRRIVAEYCGPYGWQSNSPTRIFEYPWVYERITELGSKLRIADVGASLAGMQFTLARDGHDVHAVDPGMNATGKGWELDPATHRWLQRVYHAPVTLHVTTLDQAEIPPGSLDVVLSVSAIEHFSPTDLADFGVEVRKLLCSGGHIVFTVDLFLDLSPFTSRSENPAGRNVNLHELLSSMNATLVSGNPAELHGFPEFDADRVQSNLSQYMVGAGMYNTLVQCVAARVD